MKPIFVKLIWLKLILEEQCCCAKVSHAKLSGGWIYGVSVWDLDGEVAEQIDPAIQKHNELRLIKARELKVKSASAFIDDKGLGNQSTE
jgi:hypothetical protein